VARHRDLSKVHSLVALDEFFTSPGPNYRKNDSAMATIFAIRERRTHAVA
jgi:hypothetical protein